MWFGMCFPIVDSNSNLWSLNLAVSSSICTTTPRATIGLVPKQRKCNASATRARSGSREHVAEDDLGIGAGMDL